MLFLSLLAPLLLLAQFTLCVPQAQIFDRDWQTVQIGKPFFTIFKDEKLISLTEKGVLAIQDIQSGNVTYRFQSEAAFDGTSVLVDTGADDQFATVFNYPETDSSRIILWRLNGTAFVRKEADFDHTVVGTFATTDAEHIIAAFDDGSFYQVGVSGNTLLEDPHEGQKYAKARYVESMGGLNIFILQKDTYLFSKEEFVTISEGEYSNPVRDFTGCRLDFINFQNSFSRAPICIGKAIYTYWEKSRDARGDTQGPFHDMYHLDKDGGLFETVNDQYAVTFANGNFSLYDVETSVEPVVTFQLEDKPQRFSYYYTFVTGGDTLNMYVVTDSLEVMLISNGKIQWVRDESVAYIKDAVVVDGPEALGIAVTAEDVEEENTNTNLFSAYVSRLQHNFAALTSGEKLPENFFDKHFGLLKRLVVLTENGKLAAFDTHKTGADTDQDVISSHGSTFSASTQLVWITEPELPIDKLYKVGNQTIATSGSNFYAVDVTSGSLSDPLDDEFVSANFKLVGSKLIQTQSEEFYTLEVQGNDIQGWHYEAGSPSETWRINLDKNETLVGVSTRSYGNENVAVNAITLGSRDVLYKYLIPNLAIVSVYKAPFVTLNLINVVTGQVYNSFTSQTNNPMAIHVLFEENFVLLSTQEKESIDTKVTAIEMFESLSTDVKRTGDIDKFSAFSNQTILPEYSMRTYVLPGVSVEQMSLTHTKSNIALKYVLLTTSTGSLVAVPRPVLNGRRPFGPPPKGTLPEPYMSPYEANVAINEKLVLSHHRKLIVGNEYGQILSVPTELESTSVVISIDSDLFVTIVRPSESFDTLMPDFNKKILLLTIAVLIAAILYTKPLAASKKLKDQWRAT